MCDRRFHSSCSSSSTLGARGLYLSKGDTDPQRTVRCRTDGALEISVRTEIFGAKAYPGLITNNSMKALGSDHGGVEALRLGRAGNRLIYFFVWFGSLTHVRGNNLMGWLREKIFSVNGLQYSMTAYVKKSRRIHYQLFFRIGKCIELHAAYVFNSHLPRGAINENRTHQYPLPLLLFSKAIPLLRHKFIADYVFPAPLLPLLSFRLLGGEGLKLWTASTTAYASFSTIFNLA